MPLTPQRSRSLRHHDRPPHRAGCNPSPCSIFALGRACRESHNKGHTGGDTDCDSILIRLLSERQAILVANRQTVEGMPR